MKKKLHFVCKISILKPTSGRYTGRDDESFLRIVFSSGSGMKIGIVIPAYNAGHDIRHVLLKALVYIPKTRICVVDDGSTDNTANVATSLGVMLLRHHNNCGKGNALKSGFRFAVDNDWDGVITLDADGQHDPEAIPRFISIFSKSDCDIALGTRVFRVGEMPLDRICSNRLSSLIVSCVSKMWIPDSQCGYRLIKTEVLRHIDLESNHFETESELIIKAARKGYTFAFCPVAVRYHSTGSHIRRWNDTRRFCRLILNHMFNKTG
jgi:glycosyltransferase involved in cell wall biosynthesis